MFNQSTLLGNVGADPKVTKTQNGIKVATFNMATTETWKNKAGEKCESTEWHRIVAFGGLAGVIEEYIKKGSKVFIQGRKQTREYDDKDGTKKYMTEVVAKDMKMLSPKGAASSDSAMPEEPVMPEVPWEDLGIDPDEAPF